MSLLDWIEIQQIESEKTAASTKKEALEKAQKDLTSHKVIIDKYVKKWTDAKERAAKREGEITKKVEVTDVFKGGIATGIAGIYPTLVSKINIELNSLVKIPKLIDTQLTDIETAIAECNTTISSCDTRIAELNKEE